MIVVGFLTHYYHSRQRTALPQLIGNVHVYSSTVYGQEDLNLTIVVPIFQDNNDSTRLDLQLFLG